MKETRNDLEPIAVIGIGCRFPGGVNSPETYWKLLTEGVDAISEVPSDRWDIETYYDPDRFKKGKTVSKWGGFLDKIDQFDVEFFGMSPREAVGLDPQQRLLLKASWEALEDGGQVLERLAGSDTGVFIGGFTLDYKLLQFTENNRHLVEAHTATGSMMTLLSNRISYVFDFRGPSVSLDTACSSSLVAVHLACQSLWNGETSLALAGGANVMLKPDYTIAESKAGMLSPDGRSKAFDSSANGYVRGEGVGVVVLKPLSKALADGDHIYASIKATAVNQDGHSNGLTVPRGESQEALLRQAYSRAGIEPREVQYMEAHGTGTPVGDPIEVNALGKVLSTDRPEGNKCFIGSVKTNFGHTEAAAGIAGLIKTVLSMKHKAIPPHLHLNDPNPQIRFDQHALEVPRSLTPWPKTEGPAIAGVNSFGFGGTNAHVVLQEAPPATMAVRTYKEQSYIFPASGRSLAALKDVARSYKQFLEQNDSPEASFLHDLCYTGSMRRTHHGYRLAAVTKSKRELTEQLQAFIEEGSYAGLSYVQEIQNNDLIPNSSINKPIVFVYSGMGPQWWAMGRQLLEKEPVFRQAVEECDQLLQPYTGWSLLNELLKDEEQSLMEETEVAQPAIFALQVGLTALWRSWGIKPDAIVGHSAGEVAAAYAAGVYSIEQAALVIYHRSRLQQKTTGLGRLVAVGLSPEEIQPLLQGYEDRVSIAAINSPTSLTLVGDPIALEMITKPLEDKGVFCRYLRGKVPYHSHYMEPLKEELMDCLKDLSPQNVVIPLYSTVTGEQIDGASLNADYWWKNVRNPVYFAASIQELLKADYSVFVEISPHPVLINSIVETMRNANKKGVVITSLRRNEDEKVKMLEALGQLYTTGYPVDWKLFYPDAGKYEKLPTYPWQRERYWQESEASEQERLGYKVHPLLGRQISSPLPTWEVEVNTTHLTYLNDHRIQGAVVFPGAAYAEMGWAAAREVYKDAASILAADNVQFRKALFIPDGETVILRLIFNPKDGEFNIYSASRRETKDWTLHASGKLVVQTKNKQQQIPLLEIKSRCSAKIESEECYQQFRTLGLEYGETFRGIDELWQGFDEAVAKVSIPADLLHEVDKYNIHPAVLDLCFQVLAAALPFTSDDQTETVYMPTGVNETFSYEKVKPEMWIYARIISQTESILIGDIFLMDEQGHVIFEINKCHARSLKEQSGGKSISKEQSFYDMQWQPQQLDQAERVEAKELKQGKWLIFADQGGVGQSIAKLLVERGESYVMIYPGESFCKSEQSDEYQIQTSHVEQFRKLIMETAGADLQLKGIIHLWNLDAESMEQATLKSIREAELLGSISVLHLVQTVAEVNWRTNPRLWIITRNAQSVVEHNSPVQVLQAPVWGLGKVIHQQEHRDIGGGMIDLDSAPASNEAECILDEITGASREDQIAFRQETRYVAKLMERTDIALPIPPILRMDGSYLITGGFGALGLLIAKWLVEHGARHLILMGRQTLPERHQWNQVPQDSPVAARIQAVKELEQLGAFIHVAAVDVSDEMSLSAYIEEYQQENWPEIRGVIHSAGVAHPKILLRVEQQEFSQIMEPKMIGSWNLHKQFEHKSLDFFVLFSSIASVVVSTGQGSYSAANAFLDGLAHYRKAIGLPAVSINWGPWGQVGMATQLDLLQYFIHRGFYPMTNDQGLEAFGYLLGQKVAQATVVGADWPVVAEVNFPLGLEPTMLSVVVSQGKVDSGAGSSDAEQQKDLLEELLAIENEVDRRDQMISYLQDMAAIVLRLNRSKLSSEQTLSHLGLDSMMAIELKNRMDNAFKVNITIVDLLKGPSIAQLADQVLVQMIEQPVANINEETAEVIQDLENYSSEQLMALLQEVAAGGEKE
ncbi:SDR family NAD(P)-dependent oxidoreductase [Paenibacillus sp. 5J-6]|uniref:SDR family NAD(P)-dependent oxidoreductase n=1 Tax=Paenibacillus silvestris TaxID=2606219 RepID=A0A6L8URN0_9BACL|nr:type I polyketide synthase [Paenibacillus silvestris]MZQ80587.1 SDR family NAD(P)-dependent oxidoreductase [Paenibacillus silvestris]